MVTFARDLGYKSGWMKLYTRVTGLTTRQKVKEYFGMPKVTYILGTSRMIKLMGTEYISISMAAGMKGSGSMTCNRDRVKRSGLMAPSTMANM